MLRPRFIASILALALSYGCGDPEDDTQSSDSITSSSELECEPPLEECSDACVDLMSDIFNCGDCGLECDVDQFCEIGECVDLCDEGLTYCSDTCVDLLTDDDHCGSCGRDCSDGFRCDGVEHFSCP